MISWIFPAHAQEKEGDDSADPAPAWSGHPHPAPNYLPVESPAPEDPMVLGMIAAMPGASLDDVRGRIMRQDASAELLGFVHDIWPESFAGGWISEDGGNLHIALSSTVDGEESFIRARYPFPHHLVVERVPLSRSQLLSIRDELIEVVVAKALYDDIELYVDFSLNAVIVEAVRVSDALGEFGPLLDRQGVLVREVGRPEGARPQQASAFLGEGASCASRSGCVQPGPLRSGLDARPEANAAAACTWGFTARNASGTGYLLTAGHCAIPGEMWRHNHRRVGGIPRSISPYAHTRHTGPANIVDAARAYVPPSYGWNLSRWVYASPAAPSLQVQGVRNRAQIAVGHGVCKAGISRPIDRRTNQSYRGNGEECGPVSRVEGQHGRLLLMFRHTTCGGAGDSGAPVYSRYNPAGGAVNFRAYGMVSTSNDLGGCNEHHNPDYLYSSYAQTVQEQLDVQIITN